MLNMNEVLICRPGSNGAHRYEIKRRTAHAIQRVSVIACSGKTALEIAHAIFDGRCDMLRIGEVAA